MKMMMMWVWWRWRKWVSGWRTTSRHKDTRRETLWDFSWRTDLSLCACGWGWAGYVYEWLHACQLSILCQESMSQVSSMYYVFIYASFFCHQLGVITALLNWNLRHDSLRHCIRIAKCKAIVYGEELTNGNYTLTFWSFRRVFLYDNTDLLSSFLSCGRIER